MKRAVECLILGVALLAGCSDKGSDTAGATSETTNGIAVIAMDGAHKPVPQARVTLYQSPRAASAESPSEDITVFPPSYVTAIETATADDSGMVQFETELDQCQKARCHVEGIAGEDSSLMVWTKLDAADSSTKEVELLPSVTLTVRTGAAATDSTMLASFLKLDATPYCAHNDGSDFVFSHVPAGLYTILADTQPVADVSLDAGASVDTLIHISNVTREYVFEDFDDGDSLNNLAKDYPNFGWYYGAIGKAKFIVPDSATGFTGTLVQNGNGKILSLQFETSDSGYVLIGTHLGLDTAFYDLSSLTAIRIKVRGDCKFNAALEHYKEIDENTFRKALWAADASENWSEIVLRPGEEILDSNSYQVHFDDIAEEIGIFTIFITSGTTLQVDEIVFEGLGSITSRP